jgi:ribosome biogenesis GTPase / thiamine phosphate phosphatase
LAAPRADLDLGLVVSGHGRHCVIETPEGRRLIAHPRGKKSEVLVGDRVRWQPTGADSGEGVIEHIEPRRSLLYRQDDWKTKAFAANIDQVLVMVAVVPVFSESQMARALVAAADAEIPAHIVLNKIDLPTVDEARSRLASYRAMGVKVVEVALKADPEGSRQAIGPLLQGRSTLVLGPSGVGKSSLVNRFVPDAQAQIGEVSVALNSGRHTTTHTRWFWLDPSTRSTALVDSPGFQQFGLRQIDAARLAHLMPDIEPHVQACRFYNCTHRHEPGCGVLAAIERGEITASRARIHAELTDELLRERPR